MATNYLKPQEPLKKIDKDTGDINYLYPLTTPDQVVMENGDRLNAKLDEIDADIISKANVSDVTALQSALDGKLSTTGTAAKATADASGNVITDTYATKAEVPEVVEDFLSDLGAITIDLEGATEGTVAGIDADTFQGYTIDKFVMYNINGEDGDIDTTIDADMLGGIPASEYATKAYVEELLGGIENGSY